MEEVIELAEKHGLGGNLRTIFPNETLKISIDLEIKSSDIDVDRRRFGDEPVDEPICPMIRGCINYGVTYRDERGYVAFAYILSKEKTIGVMSINQGDDPVPADQLYMLRGPYGAFMAA